MDNKTQSFQFRKTKLALAVAMTVSLAACGVDGDEGSVSTSNSTADASQPTSVNQNMPKGSIQGSVFDTNGHAVVGATVTVAGQTATTDASGSYLFNDVQVTNVAGADANTNHNPFVVVIQAPEGYASTATVNVTPNAQIDAANNDSVGTPLTTFVDGFLAQAGTAIMPKKDSVVEGWIRNQATGEAIADATVSLDFTGLSATVVAGGANVALSGDSAKVMTDANGYFRFEGVYDDSAFNIAINDYRFLTTTTTPTSADVVVTESYANGAAAAGTVTTANKVKAGSTFIVKVNGVVETTKFANVNGVLTAIGGATTTTAGVAVANRTESYTIAAAGNVTKINLGGNAPLVTNIDSLTFDGVNVAGQFQIVNGEIVSTVGAGVAVGNNTAVVVTWDGTESTTSSVVPANALVEVNYTHVVAGSTTSTSGGQVVNNVAATTAEGMEINVGTLQATPITSADTVMPYVSGVNGWIQASTGGYAILNKGVDTVFTINFSEPVHAGDFNAAGIIVTDSSASQLTLAAENGAVLAADGRSVTITLAEAQKAGAKISIFIPWQDTKDVAGNFFSTTANDSMNIDFDSKQNSTTGKAAFLRVNLCVFKDAVLNIDGFAAVQDFDAAVGIDAGSTDLAAYSNAFLDNQVTTGDANLRQLNGDEDSAVFLNSLADLVADEDITIDNDHAWVKVTKGTASGYTYTGGAGTTTASSVWFDGVKPGQSKTFTFLNDLSLAAGSAKVTLVDAIKPTTTLQQNYNLIDSADYSAQIVTSGEIATQGAGGEVTEIGEAATIGNPIVYIQPRHLTPTIAANNTADRGKELDALTDDVAARSAVTGTPTPRTVQDTAATAGNDPFVGANQPIYDDAAFAAWTAADRANSLGVNFTEDIAMVTGATPIFSGSGVTLGNFSALVDVEDNIDGSTNGTDNDLVRMTVSDMVALANDNHNATIAFSGDVQDAYGNVADDNSRATVVIRDAMPPMVTSASYNGADVTITFNEALGSRTALNNAVISIDDFVVAAEVKQSITLNSAATGAAEGAFVLSADSKTLTVQLGGKSDEVSDLFDNATAEYQWQEVGSAALESHVALAWDTVEDARGNKWSSFDRDTVGTAALDNRYEVVAPRFYMFDNVGPFTYSVATAGYDEGAGTADENGNVVFTINFTHPIDLALGNAFSDAIDGADANGATPDPITNLSYSTANAAGAAVLNALFVLELDNNGGTSETFGTGVVSPTNINGSVAISSDNRTITLTIDAADDAIDFGVSTFGFVTTVTSAINGDITTSGNFNWQNTN